MGLLGLFITACVPVFNMLLVTGVGSFLASDFAGILGKEARKHLNNIVFYVFEPSLVAIYLAKTTTMESFAKLGNWGNIFFIIIPALCKEKGSPFGAPDVCQTYGLAYSSLSMAIGSVFLWTIVYNIARATSKVAEGDFTSQNKTKALNSESATETDLEENCSTSNDQSIECTLPLISKIPPSKDKAPLSERGRNLLSERGRNFFSRISGTVDLKKLFAPSAFAVIVGFIIGGTPLIRNAIVGGDAPLRVLQESAELIGGAAVPSVTLIMGANLLNGVRGEASVPPSIIVSVIVVRFVLLPLLGTGLVKGAVRLGLIRPDPLYQFILLLQYAVPPAMNIGTIMQQFGVGESECSVIFVWAYALASVAVTVWSAFFMWTLSP
ncbi:hypothetical protein ACP70R_006161 [Stipagrostis hirtigluma subsp. patula]